LPAPARRSRAAVPTRVSSHNRRRPGRCAKLAVHGTPAQRTSGRRQPSAALPTRPASFVLDIVNDGGDDATSDYGDDDDDAAIDYDDGGDDAASDYDDGGDDTAPASCLRR